MRRRVVTDNEKCTGCGICELICSSGKDRVFNRRLSRIKVVTFDQKHDVGLTCRFCETPNCVRSCPRNALRKRECGTIAVDESKCRGCDWCIQACDFGTISLHPEKHVAILCDLCEGEGQPKCVRWCPTGALSVENLEVFTGKCRASIVKRLIEGKKWNHV